MKILNIFKKETKKATTPVAQKLDKNQLEKVIGGDDALNGPINTSRSNIRTPSSSK